MIYCVYASTTTCHSNSCKQKSYQLSDVIQEHPFHERRRGNAILWCCLDARRPMHRPNPRQSPLLSRPRPPKVAPVPVAATASPPSILSLAHVLGLVFASFFLSSSYHPSTLSNAFGSYTRCALTSSYQLLTTNHIHWLSHERRQSQQL
jgi:hypothetical protein